MDRQLGDIRPATEPDDEAALPRFELDRPLVLLAGAVLREQAREVAVITQSTTVEPPSATTRPTRHSGKTRRRSASESATMPGTWHPARDAAARCAAWARCGRRRGTARAAPRTRRLPAS